MNKALILKDNTCSVVLIDGKKTYTSLGEFLKILALDKSPWSIEYVNLHKAGLISLIELSSLLISDIVTFRHLEKYSESIENFII